MKNILYFAFKYLKRTFEKKSHEIGYIKFGLGMKYLLNTVQYGQYCASKDLKRTFGKTHVKSGQSDMVLV